MRKTKTIVVNKLGLHARAAARLVQTASEYDCSVQVCANGKQADGKSIMEIMMLAAGKDNEIEICASGLDEAQAINRLLELVASRFGEEE